MGMEIDKTCDNAENITLITLQRVFADSYEFYRLPENHRVG